MADIDPMDAAALEVAAEPKPGLTVITSAVRLDDAKRIRDKAVAEAFGQGQRHGYDAAQAEAWACVHVWLGGPPPEGTSLADAIRLTIDSALASATGEGPC